MSKHLRIRLGVSSLNKAIGMLEEYEKSITQKRDELIATLTMEAAGIAASGFGSRADVLPEIDGGTGKVIATGDERMFIAEFGAGDMTDGGTFPNATGLAFPIEPGSYSRTVGSGEYERTGEWHFGGKPYTEVAPQRPMFFAEKLVEEIYEERAKEVFGK